MKQADQSWGAPTGTSEWNDEKAGEAIAKADENGAGGWDSTRADPIAGGWDSTEGGAVDAANKPTDIEGTTTGDAATEPKPAAEPEAEDNSKSYAEYLAEQAEKKLKLGAPVPEARKPNEGRKPDKKWEAAKPLPQSEGNEEYFSGKGEKARREKQRKEKNILDVDLRYVEPSSGRGDRGRGGRGGRGEYRGGERGRGRGRGRGDGDGYRGRGDGESRGVYRGGRGGRGGNSVNVSDENAFPSLGGS